MAVVGSAEFEMRATRAKLANDLKDGERQTKESLDRIERQTEQKLTKMQRSSRLRLGGLVGDAIGGIGTGANPVDVAMGKAPQILDAVASSGVRASAAMIGVGAGLSAAAAGVVLLAAAWQKGEDSALQYERAATGVGRTAGLTAAQLEALTMAAAEQGEVSIKAAREQAVAYLATGQIGGEAITRLIELGKDFASFMGVDAADATKQLAKAMLDPKKAGEDLTLQFGLLTQEQLKQIDAMVEAGDLMGAQKVLLEQLDGAVSGHASKLGEIESAWDAIGRSISDAIEKAGQFLYTTQSERLQQIIDRRASIERGQRANGRPLDARTRGIYDTLGREGSEILNQRQQAAAAAAAARANQAAERERLRAEEEARRKGRSGGSRTPRSSGVSPRAADTLKDLAAQREALQLQMQIALLRAKGLNDEAQAVQRRLEVLSLTKQLEAAGVDDAAAKAQAQVDALAEAEARQRGLNNAREEGKRWLDLAVDAQRANADEALQRVRYETEIARLAGDPKAIEKQERELYIQERVNELLRDRVGLITAADLASATSQATSEADEIGSADREGRLREEFRRSFTDGLRAAMDGDIGGLFESLADRFTSRMLDNLSDDLFDILMKGGKGGGGAGGGNIFSSIASLFSKGVPGFASGGSITKGGLAYVHQGEVLANLSAGTSVIPAHAVRAMGGMAGGMGGAPASGGSQVIQVEPSQYFDVKVREVTAPQSAAAFSAARKAVPSDMARTDRYTLGRRR